MKTIQVNISLYEFNDLDIQAQSVAIYRTGSWMIMAGQNVNKINDRDFIINKINSSDALFFKNGFEATLTKMPKEELLTLTTAATYIL